MSSNLSPSRWFVKTPHGRLLFSGSFILEPGQTATFHEIKSTLTTITVSTNVADNESTKSDWETDQGNLIINSAPQVPEVYYKSWGILIEAPEDHPVLPTGRSKIRFFVSASRDHTDGGATLCHLNLQVYIKHESEEDAYE